MKTSYLAQKINGKLIGSDKSIEGIFNILSPAKGGDVVIRHWIDENGIKMASERGVSCIITEDLRENALKMAIELDIPLIIIHKIEFANAFAINWAVEKYASDSLRVVVTGTNGKSTTSHMIYSILKEADYITYTNTDSKSEFNTLIDPMVSKQIAEFGKKIEAMVIEISEVQGWFDRLMENHAFIMTSSVEPQVVVVTNVSMDHIGLVNSIEEMFDETSGAVKALNEGYAILNFDDPFVRKMKSFTGSDTEVLFFGNRNEGSDIELRDEGIFYRGDIMISLEDLPFKSQHFIANIMAAIGASIALGVDKKIIKKAISLYKPLKRRFSILSEKPLIIDDFAHNPAGILATIKNAVSMGNGKLCVVSAIRGSRGEPINKFNAEAIADGLRNFDYKLVITNSSDVVDSANTVLKEEENIFIETLKERKINYIFRDKLYLALEYALKSAEVDDVILLIGAQGMDPAKGILKEMKRIN